MNTDAPIVRASYAKTVIGTIKQSPPSQRDAMLVRLDDTLRAEIRELGLLDWMPASHFAMLVNVVYEVLRPAQAKQFWKRNLLTSLERRLLSPLRLGAIAIHGKSPRSLLKMTPQAWELVSRNCGSCTVIERPPNSLVLRFEGLPLVLRLPSMLPLWSGGSESCIERMDFDGRAEAESDAEGLSQGIAQVYVDWRAR